MTIAIKNKKSAAAIAAVLALGVALGAAILRTDKSQPTGEEHGSSHAESASHADDEHHGREQIYEPGYGIDGVHLPASSSASESSADFVGL